MSVMEIVKSPEIEALIERRQFLVAVRQDKWAAYERELRKHQASGRVRRGVAVSRAEVAYDAASHAADRASMAIEMQIRREHPEAPQAEVMRAWQAWA